MNSENNIHLKILEHSLRKSFSIDHKVNTVIITSSLALGGAEKTLFNICDNIHKDDINVINLSYEQFYSKKLKENGVHVFNLNCHSKIDLIKKLPKLFYIIFKLKPKNIQTWMYHSDFLSVILKFFFPLKNYFWGIRNGSQNLNFSTKIIVYLLAFFSYFIPEKIISCAHASTKMHVKKFGYNRKKFLTIINGVNTKIYFKNLNSRAKYRKKLLIDDNTFTLCMVARWHQQKDHITLLNALANLLNKKNIDIKLILAGKDIDKKNYELINYIHNKNIFSNVILLGEIENIYDIYNASDLNILCSSGGEGFPNVLSESMACGTPCISTKSGDAKEIINKYGWLVDEGNSNELILKILDAISKKENKVIWEKNSNNSIEHIKSNFSLTTMTDCYYKLWNINRIKR